MKSLNPRSRISYKILATAAVTLIIPRENAVSQSSKSAQQPLYLSNPAPRPLDLEQQYGGDPAGLARQQLAALRIAQLRQDVIVATNKLLLLTQDLKADMEKHENNGKMISEEMSAEQIEELCKEHRGKTKSQ